MSDLSSSEGLYGEPPQGPPAPEVPAPSLAEQVLGVFTDPVALFQRLQARPAWKGALGLIIGFTLAMILVWGLKVDVDALMRPMLEQNPRVRPEDIDKTLEVMSKFLLPSWLLGALLMTPLLTLVSAWLYWLVGKWTAEAEPPRFRQALAAATVPNLVLMPHALLVILMCLVKPINGLSPEKIPPTSLGYFLTLESPKLMACLYRLDLFTLASLLLLFLAARHTLRLKVSGAAACAALAALLLVVMAVASAK